MKKQTWIAGFLLLALLTGCGAKKAAEQPEGQEQAEEAEQAEAGANPTACEPERYLLSEEALAYMYQDGRPNGFDFDGVEEDGAFFYEFTRPEELDFSLRISEDFETAVLSYRGKTLVLEGQTAADGTPWYWHISAGYGGAVSGYGMPLWADMTGDGQADLLYLREGTGTGFHRSDCLIFDMTTVKEVPVIEPWQEMAEFIDIETLGEEDGYIQCLVTDAEGHTDTTYMAAGYDEEDVWKKFDYMPVRSDWTALGVHTEEGTWLAIMKFGMADPHFGAFRYIGELTTELAYDAEQNSIVRSGPITVTVYAPDKV